MIKTVLNAAALVLGMAGIYFKHQHWAGAGILLMVGFALLLISTVAFTLSDNTTAGTPSTLNFVMVGTLAVSILAVLFKAMYWKGGFALSMSAGGLLLVLSIMLLAARSALVASRQFVTVLIIFCTLLVAALNLLSNRTPAPADTAAVQEVVH